MNKLIKKIFAALCLVLAVTVVFSLGACNASNENSEGTATNDNAGYTASSDDEAISTSALVESSTTDATDETDTTAQSTAATEATEEATQQATNSNGQEIFGAGSKSQPYLETPDSSMKVKTVSIPAGKALYYDIYRAGGKYMTINSANAYVIYNGTRYNANGGTVSLVVGSALASEAVSFQIGNAGSKAESFTITFYDLVGSFDNPKAISKLDGKEIVTTLYAGNDTGYHYEYKAEKNGTVRFYVKNELKQFLFSATRYKKSDGMEIPLQYTFDSDYKTDSNGNYIEFEVAKGESIMIIVSSYPKGAYYPAATVKWYGTYA